MITIPRAEHPRPQWMRETWQNLNGLWQFEIDNGRSGIARGYAEKDHSLAGEITVPFCPQSKLSGVEYKDFILGAWYRRTVEITE
ncbi:MAG: beta-galactosidase, partial [Clostridia bacterium]|nr:beta-galactosidase [Clostridia bacterium]